MTESNDPRARWYGRFGGTGDLALLRVDSRGRISLGPLAAHKSYVAIREGRGEIRLVPAEAMIVPIADADDPSTSDPSTGAAS